jgi:hypothetical protein
MPFGENPFSQAPATEHMDVGEHARKHTTEHTYQHLA